MPRSARDASGPPRRSRHARNRAVIFFNFVLSAALFAMLTVAAIAYWGISEFRGEGPLVAESTYLVTPNTSLQSIANGLERNGIISNAEIFEYGVRLAGSGGELKAGEYAFAPGASMQSVMEKLRSGDSIIHQITIPEGWTVYQVYERIENNDVLVGEMPETVPEGSLLPETYSFTRGMTREEIVGQMAEAHDEVVAEIWAGREEGLPIETVEEFVTLASIVERETGVASERPLVAGVFINRLEEGMRLQSDPTFLYGIYGGEGKPSDQPILQSHIESDTPYNTYVIDGLPPGPIANPGRASLEAVAHPAETDALYFVADGTGGHAFAETLEEHNANVQRYREIQRQADAEAAGSQ